MKNKKLWWLGGLVALAVIAGCVNPPNPTGGDREPLVPSYRQGDHVPLRPEIIPAQAVGRDALSEMFADDLEAGTRPADPRYRKKSCVGCAVTITGARSTNAPLPAPVWVPTAPTLPASSGASAASGASTSLMAPAPANPFHAIKRASAIGSYDNWMDTFGYRDGALVYRPMVGPSKSVAMAEQSISVPFKCEKRLFGETSNFVSVLLQVVVKPSLQWEIDYHKLVTEYGRGDNVVDAADVVAGVINYIGQHQEWLCIVAHARSLDDVTRNTNLGVAEALNDWFRRDQSAPFQVMVQTTNVVLPDDLKQYLERQGVQALKQTCCPCAAPSPRRPALKKPIPICETRK